jgi:hypothetical protein
MKGWIHIHLCNHYGSKTVVVTKPVALSLKMAGLAASVSLASLVAVPKANAITLFTDNASFSNAITELNAAPVLTLDKYTPQAGETVTQVIVRLNASLRSEGSITNVAANPQTFTVSTLVAQYNVTPSLGSPSSLRTLTPFAPFALIGARTYTSLPPNTPTPFGSFTINGSDSLTLTSAGDIAQLLEGGTFSFNPFTQISTSITGGGGNVTTNIATFASAFLEVEYIGDRAPEPIPEPVSMGLLVSIGGLFAMKKKFGSQTNKVKMPN